MMSSLLEHKSCSPCYFPQAPNKVLAQSRFSCLSLESCHTPVTCSLSLSLSVIENLPQ